MRNLRLILHEKNATAAIQEAVERLRERGHSILVDVTREPGDAVRFAEQARSEGVDILVAGGGDGTLNEVVNGVLHADKFPEIAVAVCPIGTANDFARSCLIPDDPFEALLLAAEGGRIPIDVAKANERLFLNVANSGFGAEVAAGTPSAVKKVIGSGAYSLAGLIAAIKMQSYGFRVSASGFEERGMAFVIAVGNGRQTGGGFEVAPRAFINDGLLDLMIVREFPLRDIGTVLKEVKNLGEAEGQYVSYRQLPSSLIEYSDETPVNFDGEPARLKEIKFEILRRRLPFILPKDTPLLLNQ